MNKKHLIDLIGMFFSAVVSVIISNIFLPMSISVFVGVVLLLIIFLLWVINFNKDEKQKMIEEIDELKNNLKEVEKKNTELQNFPIESTLGNRLFLMAISQDLSNPLFIGILEKAVFDEKNILAGYLLGNIYSSGLEQNGKIIIKCDYNMATKVYRIINENDQYGVSDWMLGWFYQLNLIDDAQAKTEEENVRIAREYYECSRKKGYPKAFNSLANLMINKHAGFDASNEIEAISLYHEAAKLNDNYALLNCGHYYKNQRKNYAVALKYYLQSAELNCPEGCVNVGEIYEILSTTDNGMDNENLIKACHNYISCIKLGESFSLKNQKKKFVAKAYYKLGNIMNNMDVLDEEIKSFFDNMEHRDFGPHCLSNAYDILTEIIDSLSIDNNEEFIDIYKNLRDMYRKSF